MTTLWCANKSLKDQKLSVSQGVWSCEHPDGLKSLRPLSPLVKEAALPDE
jgi:hypothetical protein